MVAEQSTGGRIYPWESETMQPWALVHKYKKYAVSDQGEVASLDYLGTGRPRILKPQKRTQGYLFVTLSKGNRQWQVLVHRLVAWSFVGKQPPGFVVNHKNGIKTDNRAENLEWVTLSENCLHAYRTGLHVISDHHRAQAVKQGMRRRKLTMAEAENIRWLFATGRVGKKKLARMYRIDLTSIRDIIDRKSYTVNQ